MSFSMKDAVACYLRAVGQFGEMMPLSGFSLQDQELRAAISGWEEDYHLSRHYELVPTSYRDAAAQNYTIDGIEYHGIIFHPSVAEFLEGA